MAARTQTTRRTRRCRGFSLLELVVVIVVIAVAAAVGIPRYTNSLCRYRAEVAARRVAADISLARNRARVNGASQAMPFTVGTSSYAITGMAGLDNPSSAYTVSLSAKPYEASLVSASFGGTATLTFDGYGSPAAGGQVVVRAGTFSKTIVVDGATGEAKVQ